MLGRDLRECASLCTVVFAFRSRCSRCKVWWKAQLEYDFRWLFAVGGLLFSCHLCRAALLPNDLAVSSSPAHGCARALRQHSTFHRRPESHGLGMSVSLRYMPGSQRRGVLQTGLRYRLPTWSLDPSLPARIVPKERRCCKVLAPLLQALTRSWSCALSWIHGIGITPPANLN